MYNRHYKTVYATNLGASVIQARSRMRVGTLIPKSHVSQIVTQLSFFIPQPPAQQRPATASPTRNTHHHEHPWPPTHHDNRLTTKHDNHTHAHVTNVDDNACALRCPLPRHTNKLAAQNTKGQTMASTQGTTSTAQQQQIPLTTLNDQRPPTTT